MKNTLYKTEKILSHLDGYCTLESYKDISLNLPNQYRGLLNSAVETLLINSNISTESISDNTQFDKDVMNQILLKFKSTVVDLIGDINDNLIDESTYYAWFKTNYKKEKITLDSTIEVSQIPSFMTFIETDGKVSNIRLNKLIELIDNGVMPLLNALEYIFKYVSSNIKNETLKPFNLTIYNKSFLELPQLKNIFIKLNEENLTIDNVLDQMNKLEIFEEINPNRQYLVNNFMANDSGKNTIVLGPLQVSNLQDNLDVIIDKCNSINKRILNLFTSSNINDFINYCLSITNNVTQENRFCIELFLHALKIHTSVDLIVNLYIRQCLIDAKNILKLIKE